MIKFLHYIFFILILLSAVKVRAQQDPHFSLYRYNMNVINPAYAGTNGNLEALFGIRSQWSGIQDGPETQNFNINSPLNKNMGAGFTIVNDEVFVLKETHLYADFSYKIQVAEDLNLYAGIKAGGTFLNISLSGLDIDNDPLFNQNVSKFNPNVGVGFYLKAENYYITLSAPGLISNDRFEKEGVTPVSGNENSHVFLGGGYDVALNDDFKLKPSILSKIVTGAPLSIDLTASAIYRDRLELGSNYRWDESITFFMIAGFSNNAFNFGYAYESTTTDIKTYNNGTHEIILKFRLN
ncbi:PorP/SprF family type IX secretion system membrane protein [Aquimarina sediminis]|uniref:PorP/SprF family type IX secretion system membrane protein n=1 Tax=Aquimarina sediminis TaxID=2070536 RepID=UPI000CA00691|nr:type IX secretion system membrane protein PorP/SprF [Aquimarina sediminis]